MSRMNFLGISSLFFFSLSLPLHAVCKREGSAGGGGSVISDVKVNWFVFFKKNLFDDLHEKE